jgi:hypothetical protein
MPCTSGGFVPASSAQLSSQERRTAVQRPSQDWRWRRSKDSRACAAISSIRETVAERFRNIPLAMSSRIDFATRVVPV